MSKSKKKSSYGKSTAKAKSSNSMPQKKAYNGYTVKEKWLPSLLLALFAPITLFFFGPFEIYGNNMSEFKFVLWDFWLLCGAMALILAGVVFGILMLLRGRAFNICFGLFFGLSLMFFLQGNYLSLGAGSLAGDGVGETISTTKSIVNIIIWILVVAGCVVAMLLLDKFKDLIRQIATVGVVALVGMTLISFLVISLTTDVYSHEKTGYMGDTDIDNEVLTVKNLDTLATDNNIVIFIVDRFDYTYYDKAMAECPEIFDDLDGFTHFGDYITLYPRTYPGVPHIMTGVETDFSMSREEYFKTAYSSSPYLAELKELGFDINVYTDSFYGYENATHMRDFISNTSGNVSYEIINRSSLSWDMARVSLYRYLPFLMRDTLGDISTTTYDKYVNYDSPAALFRTDMKNVYTELTNGPFTFRKAKNGVSYIHIAGCHTPNKYGPDFNPATPEEKSDSNVGMKQSFKIISAYINEMKRLGVYEDSTIIILGDHCDIGSDHEGPYKPHITGLLAKPAGVSEGEIKESKAQIGSGDIFATVLTAAGSDKASDYGVNIFDIPEDEERTRPYHFQILEGFFPNGIYKDAIYEVVGSGLELENWKLLHIIDLQKNIYD